MHECALTLEKLDVCFKCRHEVFNLVWLEGPPLLSLLQCWDHDFTEVLLDHLQHTTAITGIQHTTVQLLHGGDTHTLTMVGPVVTDTTINIQEREITEVKHRCKMLMLDISIIVIHVWL